MITCYTIFFSPAGCIKLMFCPSNRVSVAWGCHRANCDFLGKQVKVDDRGFLNNTWPQIIIQCAALSCSLPFNNVFTKRQGDSILEF